MSKDLIFCMGDTDGLKFCKKNMSPFSKEELLQLTEEINSKLEDLIYLESDGYFDQIVIIKTKNYITNENGKIKFKGSSLTDGKKEPALKEMIQEIGHSLLTGIDYPTLESTYMKYVKEACNVTDIKRWAVKKTVTKPVLESANDINARANERKVWDAISHLNPQEGDKVYVYDSIDGEIQDSAKGELKFMRDGSPKMIPNKILKTIDLYNNDTIQEKLVQRVFATIKIFETILDIEQFPNYSLSKNKNDLEKLCKL